jgi:hypothetical protein
MKLHLPVLMVLAEDIMKVLFFSVSYPKRSHMSGCHGSPHPTTAMDVTERHQFCRPIQERVLDLVEALVWTVDWLFLSFGAPLCPIFLPQFSIPTLALGLHAHMDTIQMDHIPNVGIIGVFWLGLVG